MKIVMDADCLIKLTKAGLKEEVCNAFTITIPRRVEEEVVDQGKRKDLPDAFVIERNISAGLLAVRSAGGSKATIGEKEAILLYQQGGFEAIASDDRRFVRQLRAFDIPYLTPAVVLAVMVKKNIMKVSDALQRLEALSPYISENEYYAVKLALEAWR